MDWSAEFKDAIIDGDIDHETHVAIGWGDKGFFLETPTWDDLKFSTAANALLLPSSACTHVVYTRPEHCRDAVSVTVTEKQYGALVKFIKATMRRNANGSVIQIPGHAYGTTDAFFEAKGHYHILNTCNSWVGRGLKTAGVRTPWLSPMPKTPMLYLHELEAD